MGFNADKATAKLEWDFTKYVPGAKGVSPEPANLALLQFNLRVRTLVEAEMRRKKSAAMQEADKLNERTSEEKAAEVERWATMDLESGMVEVFNQLALVVPAEEGEALSLKQAELVAEVFHDCPSVDQIMALPGRVRAAYFGWVVGQLMDPELGAVATTS